MSRTRLTAILPASSAAGVYAVTVLNPTGAASAPVDFTISSPAPVLAGVTPSTMPLGGSGTFTASGADFAASSGLTLDGVALATTLLSSTVLTAPIPAGLAVGPHTLTVTTPAPGGGTSSAATFIVQNPIAAIASVIPASATAGSAAFTLTVDGSAFVGGAVVSLAGTALSTTFVSTNRLIATVPVGSVATAGILDLTVTNPAPTSGPSAARSFTISNPVPSLASLSPAGANAGAASTTVTINGSGFVSGAVASWAGAALTTTFVSSTRLTATVPASLLASGGNFAVTATNPTPNLGSSASLTFTVNSAAPVLTSLTPSSAFAGSGAFTLSIAGTGFLAGAQARFNGAAMTTTYLSPTLVTAAIPATSIASSGTYGVTVTNPAPTVGASGTLNFVANNPTPVLTALTPVSVLVGAGAFTLTVDGTSFLGGAQITFGATTLATTYVSSTRLTAPVSAALVAAAGTVNVTVSNPTPRAGASAARTFNVGVPVTPTAITGTTWHVATTGSDTNAGTAAAPFRNLHRAVNAATSGDGIFVHAGTYHLVPQTNWAGQSDVGVYDQGKNIAIYGEDGSTVLEFYAADVTLWIANLISLTGPGSSLSHMKLNYYPAKGYNFANAIFSGAAGTGGLISNVYIENRSTTESVSFVYNNNETVDWPVVVNSVINGNGRWSRPYTGRILLINTLTDGDPTLADEYYHNPGRGSYSLVRAITAADLDIFGNVPASLLHTGDPARTNVDGSRSNIGVYGGLYAWTAYPMAQPGIAAVTPSTVSTAGGLITITGASFSPYSSASVGSTSCPIYSATSTTLVCAAPAGAAYSNPTVTVTNGTLSASRTAAFTYDPTVCAHGARTFASTGLDQSFTVPSGCGTVTAKLWGAGGGGPSLGFAGGAGGYATGVLTVIPGQVLTLIVGGGGQVAASSAAYGGGGDSGPNGGSYSAGGGGRSAIRLAGTELLTAGGGGGGGSETGPNTGGAGGGLSGTSALGNCAGGAGTQTGGGAGGACNYVAGTAGTQFQGGGGNYAGGGGGGGYYGGGSGNHWSPGYAVGGGGGGSGYAASSVQSASLQAGSGTTPPQTADASYVPGVGVGGATGVAGGPGQITLSW